MTIVNNVEEVRIHVCTCAKVYVHVSILESFVRVNRIGAYLTVSVSIVHFSVNVL